MSPSRPPVVLFDIDGTLADTNYLHVLAWRRAFLSAGFDVSAADIHRRIGMGAKDLMETLVGEANEEVKQAWRKNFDELKPEIRALPGAGDLLREVSRRGGVVVLASSSEEDDVEALLDAVDAGAAIDRTISAGDVQAAKPSPEVFQVALASVDGDVASAVSVGDTVWDIESSRRAGLACIGVGSGGISAAELREAGAVAVYKDAAELLRELDDSPLGELLAARE